MKKLLSPRSWQRRKIRLQTNWRRFRNDWQLLVQNHLAVLGLVLILLFGLVALSYPLLRATIWQAGYYNPVTGYDMELMTHPALPSWRHPLGTDGLGRDVLSMLIAATKPAFIIGFAAALTTALVGTASGTLAAYWGGPVERILMHLADGFLLLPAPLFMIIIGMRFREVEPFTLGLIYGLIAGAGGAAIVMRSHALTIVSKPYIQAARVAGGRGLHILWMHILPHMLPLTALYMMLSVTSSVVADAFVSFFGFSRNYLNWGTMIYSSFVYSSYLDTGVEWHVLIPPSIALSLFATAFYLVGRGMHEVANPRLRRR